MSRFLSEKHSKLVPYVPGEQPKNREYVKLNTNESPFPPSAGVIKAAAKAAEQLELYSDPECRALTEEVAKLYGVDYGEVLMTNGSDEILNFAFCAFGDEKNGFAFPDISYGFYSVFAEYNHVSYREIPLKDDFSVDPEDYMNIGMNIVIANPNAPTGRYLPVESIERIVASNRDNIVIIDEAYIDFGCESCMPLIKKYNNLLVTRTFSKSYSLAGARLGFGVGSAELIADLNTIKYSTNPYNVNRMTMAAGLAAVRDNDYYMRNCRVIAENREYTVNKLRNLGFEVLDSGANFIFARHGHFSGEFLYKELKSRGILIRYFDKERIKDYNRITIGSKDQMDTLIATLNDILSKGKG